MVLLPKLSPRPRDVDFELIRKVGRFWHGPMKAYFRYQVDGFENVPDGRALLVSVHNGGILPVDSFILGSAFYRHFEYKRPLHYLGHDILWKLPSKGVDLLERLGAVHGNHAHATAVLEDERALCVYPGGAWEVYRPFRHRNKIDWNGHVGYIRLAVKNRAPVVPVPSVGAHETFVVLTRGEFVMKLLPLDGILRGVHGIPFALGFPWGLSIGPFPLHIPLPAQISIRAMEPMELHNLPAGRALFRGNPKGDPDKLRELHRMVQQKVQQGMDELNVGRVPFLGRI
ncbi:MAG: lysophospholipid acyltransferase family protein [bacterium]